MTMFNPPHPGELIRQVYPAPNGISGRACAARLGVAPSTLGRILRMAAAASARRWRSDCRTGWGAPSKIGWRCRIFTTAGKANSGHSAGWHNGRMDLELAKEFCRALPGATEDVKWENSLVFSVGGKMFAVTRVGDAADGLSLKVDD